MPNTERNIADLGTLRARFWYDPWTGALHRQRDGKHLGANTGRGYLCVWVNNKRIQAHRVAWALTYGEWPEEIDHINRNRADNRLFNLRAATRTVQCQNMTTPRSNRTGVKGVALCRQTGKFKATITVARKQIWLGRFATVEAASLARHEAERRLSWSSAG